MPSGYEDFICADNFDMIMAILEEDENMEEQFQEAVQEVSIKNSNLYLKSAILVVYGLFPQKSFDEQNCLSLLILEALKQSNRFLIEMKCLFSKVMVL